MTDLKLPDELEALWDEAARNPGTEVDVGDTVVCDFCCEDMTTRPDPGGVILQSKAICPACTKKYEHDIELDMADAVRYGRRAERAQPGEAFADFVRRTRGPQGGRISVHTPESVNAKRETP